MVKAHAQTSQEAISQVVRRFVPEAELLSEHGGEEFDPVVGETIAFLEDALR